MKSSDQKLEIPLQQNENSPRIDSETHERNGAKRIIGTILGRELAKLKQTAKDLVAISDMETQVDDLDINTVQFAVKQQLNMAGTTMRQEDIATLQAMTKKIHAMSLVKKALDKSVRAIAGANLPLADTLTMLKEHIKNIDPASVTTEKDLRPEITQCLENIANSI